MNERKLPKVSGTSAFLLDDETKKDDAENEKSAEGARV